MNDLDRVRRFVLRARRVLEHSLLQNDASAELLKARAEGRFNVRVQKNTATGETEHWMSVQLPPEEAFESLVMRLRPFVMTGETVYWETVLDALERLAGQEVCRDVVDIGDLRSEWTRLTKGKREAKAYYFMTDDGRLSDLQLADYWLNFHALHSQVVTSAVGQQASINAWYKAAVEAYSRVAACVDYTMALIWSLIEMEHLEIEQSIFSTRVLAHTLVEERTRMYMVPLGEEPLPTEVSQIDKSKWTLVHEDADVMAAVQGQCGTNAEPANPTKQPQKPKNRPDQGG